MSHTDHIVDHIEAVRGYFPMTQWRRRTRLEKEFDAKYGLAADKGWVFVVIVVISVVVLLVGLLLL